MAEKFQNIFLKLMWLQTFVKVDAAQELMKVDAAQELMDEFVDKGYKSLTFLIAILVAVVLGVGSWTSLKFMKSCLCRCRPKMTDASVQMDQLHENFDISISGFGKRYHTQSCRFMQNATSFQLYHKCTVCAAMDHNS